MEPGGLVPVSHKVSFHVMSPAKSKSLYAPTANGKMHDLLQQEEASNKELKALFEKLGYRL